MTYQDQILALDIGDQWTGIAISDTLKMFAKPLETVETSILLERLKKLIDVYHVQTVIIGNPITLRGTESEQTKKVHGMKHKLEQALPDIHLVLWDERLSSKQAATLQRKKSKKAKHEALKEHAIAAAIFLQTYLDYQSYKSQ